MTYLHLNIRPFAQIFRLSNFSGRTFVLFVIICVVTFIRKQFRSSKCTCSSARHEDVWGSGRV